MDLHLDLVGGLAGDMFIAALLDLFPEHEAGLHDSLARTGGLLAGVTARLAPHNDGVLAGRRFLVERPGGAGGGHDHVAWRRIREGLEGSGLDPAVRGHAVTIFRHLAEAEARVHGVPVEAVGFHEVGAWDSIADIVGAAYLVAALGATRWTVGAVPLGSGRVRTAHGPLPVPAPATALLLQGFAVIDDGVGGERVTPTGAAILRHLCGDAAPQVPQPRIMGGAGIGFGTRILPGLSNCVRVLRFDQAEAQGFEADSVLVVECEIDDQSGEELALALDRLRAHPAVLDVIQAPVFGKKGRMMAHLRLLALPEARDEVLRLCFAETTTIGLRHSVQARAVLPRRMVEIAAGDRTLRVKAVDRPGGRTAKAEADDVADLPGHAARKARRRAAEDSVEES